MPWYVNGGKHKILNGVTHAIVMLMPSRLWLLPRWGLLRKKLMLSMPRYGDDMFWSKSGGCYVRLELCVWVMDCGLDYLDFVKRMDITMAMVRECSMWMRGDWGVALEVCLYVALNGEGALSSKYMVICILLGDLSFVVLSFLTKEAICWLDYPSW